MGPGISIANREAAPLLQHDTTLADKD